MSILIVTGWQGTGVHRVVHPLVPLMTLTRHPPDASLTPIPLGLVFATLNYYKTSFDAWNRVESPTVLDHVRCLLRDRNRRSSCMSTDNLRVDTRVDYPKS